MKQHDREISMLLKQRCNTSLSRASCLLLWILQWSSHNITKMHRNVQQFLSSDTTWFCSEFSRNHSSSTQTFFGGLPFMLKMAMELHKAGGLWGRGEKNSKKSLTHPLLFISFLEQRMECCQAKIDSAIFWSLSDVNPSQSHKCWENFSPQKSKNDS